jgi:hypothetical protein
MSQELYQDLASSLSDLQGKVKDLRHVVEWDVKTTESGIQLQGVVSVKKQGVVVGTFALPTGNNNVAAFFIIKGIPDNSLNILSVMDCKFV